jgi:hypothetical protein
MTYDLMGLQKRNHSAGDRPLFECRRHHKSKIFFKQKSKMLLSILWFYLTSITKQNTF